METILDDLKSVLRTTPQRWHMLTQSFSEDLLRRRPLEGEWSAIECLHHLIDVERDVFAERVRAIVAGQNFPAFDPVKAAAAWSDSVSPSALAAEFEAGRKESLQLIEEIAPADLDRSAEHAQLGTVTLSNLLHEWGAHDLNHLVQAEQALMQPFITGSGAWRGFFVKHDVEATGA